MSRKDELREALVLGEDHVEPGGGDQRPTKLSREQG